MEDERHRHTKQIILRSRYVDNKGGVSVWEETVSQINNETPVLTFNWGDQVLLTEEWLNSCSTERQACLRAIIQALKTTNA